MSPVVVNSFNAFGALAMLLALAWSILWLVIGWRAMKAHERLADAAAELARDRRGNPLQR